MFVKCIILGCTNNKQWISHGLQSVDHNPRIMIHGLFAFHHRKKRGYAIVEAETVAKPLKHWLNLSFLRWWSANKP